jgi:predicted NBD/HSP70 family sugar kinase
MKGSTSGRVVNVLPAVGPTWTVGMDLGDRTSHFCVLDEDGEVVERGKVQTTREGFRKRFEERTGMRIALEVVPAAPGGPLRAQRRGISSISTARLRRGNC